MKDALRGPYFRMHANILNSPKLAKLLPATKWTWVELMAVASAQCGFSGEDCQITYELEALAWYMRRSDLDVLTRQLDELESARLIKRTENGIEIHEWEFWQQPATSKERDFQSNVLRAKRNDEKRRTANLQRIDSKVTAVGQQQDSIVTAGQHSDSRVTAAGQQFDVKVTATEQKQSRTEQSSDSANQRVAPSAPPSGGLPVAPKFKPLTAEMNAVLDEYKFDRSRPMHMQVAFALSVIQERKEAPTPAQVQAAKEAKRKPKWTREQILADHSNAIKYLGKSSPELEAALAERLAECSQ